MTSNHEQPTQTFASIGIDIGKDVFHIVGFGGGAGPSGPRGPGIPDHRHDEFLEVRNEMISG